MLISPYHTTEHYFKTWDIKSDFSFLYLNYIAQGKIKKTKVTDGEDSAFFEAKNNQIEGLVRCNRLQFLIMYTDTFSKQCNVKLEKSHGYQFPNITVIVYIMTPMKSWIQTLFLLLV